MNGTKTPPPPSALFNQNIINICPVLYDSENPSNKQNYPQPIKLESRREAVLNFCAWKQDTYPWKFSFFCPWKKNSFPWKNFGPCPWKTPTAREKCQKCVRENDFEPVKKMAKNAKNGFHAHFWFSRGKKKHCHGQLALSEGISIYQAYQSLLLTGQSYGSPRNA